MTYFSRFWALPSAAKPNPSTTAAQMLSTIDGLLIIDLQERTGQRFLSHGESGIIIRLRCPVANVSLPSRAAPSPFADPSSIAGGERTGSFFDAAWAAFIWMELKNDP